MNAMRNSSARVLIMRNRLHHQQYGVSLIMVMLILVVVSLLGVGSAQIALMSERGARNERDQQMAWQAAEAGAIDAERDILGPIVPSIGRAVFDGKSIIDFPNSDCGTSGNSRGLCAAVLSGKPAWLNIDLDFASTSSSASTTEYGTFTGASFESGGLGIQPAQKPRYQIEPVVLQTPGSDATTMEQEVLYRVTVMGFGPRTDIQAVIQMLIRI
jgi:type IV pilus assembly protein PilX